MSIETDTATAPAHWLPYLVNGEAGDMTADEIAAADQWAAQLAPWRVVGDVEDSERFTWSYRLFGGTADGGTVCDYVIHRRRRRA